MNESTTKKELIKKLDLMIARLSKKLLDGDWGGIECHTIDAQIEAYNECLFWVKRIDETSIN